MGVSGVPQPHRVDLLCLADEATAAAKALRRAVRAKDHLAANAAAEAIEGAGGKMLDLITWPLED